MKKIFLLLLPCLLLLVAACCCQKNSGNQNSINDTVTQAGKSLGQVSYKYRSTGCATVVIISREKPEDEIVLIPLDTLDKEFDVDGLEIYFNYQPLKRMNPPGCMAGFPAKLSEISKK